MKGKISLYFNAENIGKVRSRVENPSKDFSGDIRTAIQQAAAEVINANMLDMRSKMIAKFQGMGLAIKDAKHAAALANPLQPFFDVVVSLEPFKGESEDNEDPTEAPAETPAETKAEKKAPKAEKKADDDFDE